MLELHVGTSRARVDAIVRDVIAAYEAAFPGRIRGYYLVGSYADGTAVASSDIDMHILFKDLFLPGEPERALALRQALNRTHPLRLDLPTVDEAGLAAKDPVGIKLGSQCVFGEDVRDAIVLPSLALYNAQIEPAPLQFMASLRGVARLDFPLDYPDPHGRWYGYDAPIEDGQGGMVPGIKHIPLIVGWIATCLLGRAGVMVARKSDVPRLYADHIGDQWSDFIALVFKRCKTTWGYRIPIAPKDQKRLRSLCQETLAFENIYLAQTEPFADA